MTILTADGGGTLVGYDLVDPVIYERGPRACGSTYFQALTRELRVRAEELGIAGRAVEARSGAIRTAAAFTALQVLELRRARAEADFGTMRPAVLAEAERLGLEGPTTLFDRVAAGRSRPDLPMPHQPGFWPRLEEERAKAERAAA